MERDCGVAQRCRQTNQLIDSDRKKHYLCFKVLNARSLKFKRGFYMLVWYNTISCWLCIAEGRLLSVVR